MSRQQDQFIDDDEEETCPLCVEEFDLTDKGFRPCPCGYQICQFCYNNVKNNMNGLCPACRRQYDDKNVEITKPTADELIAYKARQAQKQKKTQVAMQKEKQKAEADNLSRKHLAGLRVVQKNLVYVTGLQPALHEDQLLQMLRGPDYFGQYGKIIKIVVSKAKDPAHPNSVGVYVTFERRDDAERCIIAVNGSKNYDRTLRAQFGTTKYCSAYLRGENCGNRQCMFLHEPGEANESYSRADLSALNAGSSQHGASRPPPQSQQPVASAAQPMARQSSQDQPHSPPADRPALPSTASWAARVPPVQPARSESRATNSTNENEPSTDSTSRPDSQPQEQPVSAPEPASSEPTAQAVPSQQHPPARRELPPLKALLKNFNPDDLRITFSLDALPQAEREIVKNFPPLFDPNGGAKRRLRRQREEQQRQMELQARAFEQPPPVETDENPELGGSLQLGGEPEDHFSTSQPQSAIQPPRQDDYNQQFPFGGISSPNANERGLTPHQQQQMMLNTMKSSDARNTYLGDFPQTGSFGQTGNPPGHQRNTSRYSFANDSTPSTNVKPVANAKIMHQQSSIMPPAGTNTLGAQRQQPHTGHFQTSNVQGPPPGIRMTGTPPVSGGMTFGQGHGFATGGLQYGANAGLNANEERMRSLLRGREGIGAADATAKHDTDFPPLAPPSRQQSVSLGDSRRSTPSQPPGLEQNANSESRRSTPTRPPGLGKAAPLPDVEDAAGSRPSSRAGLKRAVSQITPALPLRPVTPAQTASSLQVVKTATPTKVAKILGVSEEPEKDHVPAPAASQGDAEKPMAEVAVKEGTDEASRDNTSIAEPSVVTVNKPAEPTGKTPVSSPKAAPILSPRPFQPASKSHPTVQASETQATRETPTKPTATKTGGQKRAPPGKLDIAAARDKSATAASSGNVGNASNSAARVLETQTPIEPPKSDSPSGSISSPAVRSGPRTLRVVPTAKTETPPAVSASTSVESTAPTAKLPSRKPSVASFQLPGTPSSEQVSISDNLSTTSASQSRASSPPPAANGKTSAVPTKTKNQLKKERQERAKVIEEEKKVTEANTVAAEEPAQEAIVSRKKKTKKEKEPKVKPKFDVPETGESTPTASRASSPPPKPVEASTEPEPAPTQRAKTPEPPTPTKITTEQFIPPTPREPSPPQTPTLTAAQLIAELKATTPEIQRCIDSLFRTPTSTYLKPTTSITTKDLDNEINRSDGGFVLKVFENDVDGLLNGTFQAYNYGGEDDRMWSRGMVTSSGAHLRALSEELETRFLELETAIRSFPEELRFHPTKPQNELKFPAMDLVSMKQKFANNRGRPRDPAPDAEASEFVNEFIMPPLTPPPSTGTTGGNATVGRYESAVGGMASGFGINQDVVVHNADIMERLVGEARRLVDEREVGLRKIMKRNRKFMGMG